MLALALPQVVAVGVAISLRYDCNALWPALGCAALAVVALAWSKRRGANHWLLPSLYVAGLCVSFLIIARAGAHAHEMQDRFTGIDVAVSDATAMIVVPTVLAAGLTTALLWRRWLVLAQAPAAAELAGLQPARWDVLFMVLLTTLLMFGTYAIGAVLVLAMLFLPPATVLPWCRRIPTTLVASAGIAVVILAAGFVLSVEYDWPLSHSVGGVGFAALVLSQTLHFAVRA
jgi:ABC-type Mn2+/Zn2+ transport system permease subunit